MSLIIAIEPDQEQANQLKELVRRHTRAELILADTTEHAIGAIEKRVPDLVLIPAFLSPQDDEALTAALRVKESAAHVQTLTIPVLGGPGSKSDSQPGMLSRLLRDQPRPAAPDGCDPKVFADQITAYLDRVARQKGPVKAEAVNRSNGDGRKGGHGSKRPSEVKTPKAPAVAVTPTERQSLEAALADLKRVEETAPKRMPQREAPKIVETLPPPRESEDGLAQGLSALMERLTAEDATAIEQPQPVELDLTKALNDAKSPAAPPAKRQWTERLRQLESREYAMPAILPRDDEARDTPTEVLKTTKENIAVENSHLQATQSTESAATPKPETPASRRSEWGDLIESLQKDLKR